MIWQDPEFLCSSNLLLDGMSQQPIYNLKRTKSIFIQRKQD